MIIIEDQRLKYNELSLLVIETTGCNEDLSPLKLITGRIHKLYVIPTIIEIEGVSDQTLISFYIWTQYKSWDTIFHNHSLLFPYR